MPAPLSIGNAQYTVLSTAGTTTINPGPAAGNAQGVPQPGNPGVFYGASVIAVGTTYVLDAYDIIPPSNQGTNTSTTTNKLMNGTATAAGQVLPVGPGGLGVRYKGALVVITSGTAGTFNALWD